MKAINPKPYGKCSPEKVNIFWWKETVFCFDMKLIDI
ncbi:hypothetical protein J2S07_001393 [Robertmurraya andreesenii]|uniref:Uncharacterized protein n=1 Tax=Anoxybacillus andreesenii TaxID=1325932 RepID=A0ABT9V2D3_9BACL|nr:hypothetical protein [Robertmurraya andreesenii]